MSKKRRKPTAREFFAGESSAPARDYRPTVLILLAWCVLIAALYFTSWRFQTTEYYRVSIVITAGMYIALPVLALTFIFVNHGISLDIPTRDVLSDSMTDEEKDAFIAEVERARRRARPLAYPIFPLCIAVGLDFLLTVLR